MTSSMQKRLPTEMRQSSSRKLRSLFPLVLIALLALFLGSACLSPTLPLPPPTVSSIQSADTDGKLWTITGDCVPGALVTAFNENTGEGAVVEDRDMTGRFTIVLPASLCDVGWVKQEQGPDLSSKTTFVVENLTASGPTDPSACNSSN